MPEGCGSLWDEAAAHLQGDDLHIPEYRDALRGRFSNGRIAHHLSQIAADGTTKLRMRALPVLAAERSEGRSGAGSALMLAAWIDFVAVRNEIQDPFSAAIGAANRARGTERVAALLNLISPQLGEDPQVVALVAGLSGTFTTDTSSKTVTPAHLIPGRNS